MNHETGGKMNVGYALHTYILSHTNLIIFRVQKEIILYFISIVVYPVVTCKRVRYKIICMFYSELPVAPDISSDDALESEGLSVPNFVLI